MGEQWEVIADFPLYSVSDWGRVKNNETDRILKPRYTHNGSLRVTLVNGRNHREYYVHHLVVAAFYGPIKPGEQVIHMNGDHEDNTPDNLRIRRSYKRVQVRNYPISDDAPRDNRWGRRVRIVEMNKKFYTARDAASFIQGDYGSVYACLRGERKSHKGYTFEYI